VARTDRRPRRRLDPDARRAAILDAAADAFAERPYDEVTVSAIAAQAGASGALLYRYFAGKEDLYAEIVRLAIADLLDRQAAELRDLPPGVAVQDRVRTATGVYLDHITEHPAAWALPLTRPGSEPPAVAAIRAEARREYVERLRALVTPDAPVTRLRQDYAVWGYFGFLDAACLHWVERGCPQADRAPLADAALGALLGALGNSVEHAREIESSRDGSVQGSDAAGRSTTTDVVPFPRTM
jgi:AcrR family transcriptional regulator